MEKEPKLITPILLFLAAATLLVFAWDKGPFPGLPFWGRYLLIFFAVVLGAAAVLSLANWLLSEGAERMRSLYAARVYHVQVIADAVRDLNGAQLGMIDRFGAVEMRGRLGSAAVYWTLALPTMDIPWDFVADFLAQSEKTPGYLWPVRRHDVFTPRYANSEKLCQALTDEIVRRNWAEAAAGNQPARLTVELAELAEWFGVQGEE